jgi:Xaa-Pro dipeptidase
MNVGRATPSQHDAYTLAREWIDTVITQIRPGASSNDVVGMVFAVETYCPASDGVSAARIEEEVVVTEDGPKIITLFPAEELFIANKY